VSRRKDRERAEQGWLHRGGELVRREEVEAPKRYRTLAEIKARLVRDHGLTFSEVCGYRKPPGASGSDVEVDPGGAL